MSLLDPPSFSHPNRPAKRKRPPAPDEPSSQPSSLPLPSIINPLSHSPGLVRQFAAAGLTDADENPRDLVPDFPHRPLDSRTAAVASRDVEPESDQDHDTDVDADARKAKKPAHKERGRPGGHYEVLLQSIHQFLDQGDIDKAARAYGLLLQLRPGNKPVDIKRHNLWAIGAEILMREGEQPPQIQEPDAQEDKTSSSQASIQRWGRAANMNKVKAYFDTLISQHPYDYKRPRAICAVDFWIAMLSCEIYNTHTEHVMGLDRVSKEEDLNTFDTFDIDEDPWTQVNQRKEELRLRALATMRAIAKRMDELMQDRPYSKNLHLLRLRAMAALYIADLVVPVTDDSPSNIHDVERARSTEQQAARSLLEKIISNGGELDETAMAILNQDESVNDSALSIYSSLPIRGL